MATLLEAEVIAAEPAAPSRLLRVAYRTKRGVMLRAQAEGFLASPIAESYEGKIQLIFTSPPFPLNRKKRLARICGGKAEWPRYPTIPRPAGGPIATTS